MGSETTTHPPHSHTTPQNRTNGSAVPKTRDSILQGIFSKGSRFKRKRIKFMGEEIDIRQPTLSQIMDVTDNMSDQDRVIATLIEYAYVPGTDEKVFDETHKEMLMGLPFNDDFTEVSNAVVELSTSDAKVAEKN